jgi:anti-anti-sigma regulatory factor
MTNHQSAEGEPAPPAARRARGKRLKLGADLGIERAAELKQALRRLLPEPSRVALDASEVERVHTAALQLFCLFCRDRRAEGREVEFVRPSPTLRSAAVLLGASTLLRIAGDAS